jgi:hypothetical protein
MSQSNNDRRTNFLNLFLQSFTLIHQISNILEAMARPIVDISFLGDVVMNDMVLSLEFGWVEILATISLPGQLEKRASTAPVVSDSLLESSACSDMIK